MVPHLLIHISMTKQQIFDVITDYFGEERVECQDANGRVTVHFPRVIIANEQDNTHEIKDLWIRFIVTDSGKLYNRFSVTRTSYTLAEWISDYAHSHIPGKCSPNSWLVPCTGTGPINDIMTHLNNWGDDADWMIFCRELEQWTQVESEAGVPYRHMRDISAVGRSGGTIMNPLTYRRYETTMNIPMETRNDIAAECIKRGLGAVVVQNGQVRYKLDYVYLALAISKVANEMLPASKFTTVCLKNRMLYHLSNNIDAASIPQGYYDGVYAFDFKGRCINMTVQRPGTTTTDNCGVKLLGSMADVFITMNNMVMSKLAKYSIKYGTL